MSITELFKYLGAPLKNPMWSWGAIRVEDNAVFLRVWQDRKRKVEAKWYIQVTHRAAYEGIDDNAGNNEREEHIASVRAGAKTYMVMQEAKDLAARPRAMKSFNQREVFPAGAILEFDGDIWLELCPRISAGDARRKSN